MSRGCLRSSDDPKRMGQHRMQERAAVNYSRMAVFLGYSEARTAPSSFIVRSRSRS